ncbi:hypothetical protein ACQEVS_06750 [Streptomyces sp. CA-181903]|uniref:hypothetical protein n=1 Tax=Streptomyces sp. CA-181903 TaxID=3240055 RepID=UPI003D8A9D4B
MSPQDPGRGLEDGIVVRVLDALLREDVCRLRGTARAVSRPDGERLALTVAGETVLLPVAYDGPGGAARVRAPLLETAHGPVTGLGAVLARLRPATDPRERAGFDALAAACAAELAALLLRERTREDVTERLADAYGRSAAAWTGPRGALAYDVLAARLPDPTPDEPTGIRRTPATHTGVPPLPWSPLGRPPQRGRPPGPGGAAGVVARPDVLGLPELAATHTMLPVHPLTAGPSLDRALRATGLDGVARLAEKPWADAVPTRSTGVLALVDAPEFRIELPLPSSDSAGPATLSDGVVTQRLLEEVLLCEPDFAGSVLPAAADTYLHAGHPLLTARVRHEPYEPAGDAHVVPVAALAARAPDGEPVAGVLARRYYGGRRGPSPTPS